jgi:hypothetical protein
MPESRIRCFDRSRLRGALAVLLVLGISVASVAVRHRCEAERWSKNDRHHLPGFDAFVYVAMAEAPTVFTVAPWGYRVLSPWLARAAGREGVVPGFQWLALIALSVAGPLFFAWLRLRGHAAPAAALATVAFYWTPPVGAVFFNPFMAEPIGIVLLLWLLIALERRSPGPLLALGLALGALTKDVFVLLLPGFALALVARWGGGPGARWFGLSALPALVTALSLRLAWPGPRPEGPASLSVGAVLAALDRIVGAVGEWWAPLFVSGFPLALVGALRPRGRELLRSHGLLLATALALPFGAAVYTGDALPASQFYADDVPRLLAYALPILLCLSLAAFSARPASQREPPRPGPARRGLGVVAWGAAVAAALAPLLALDPYQREDLQGRNDGHLVLAFCRQSQAFARRLARGRLVSYEPEQRRYLRGSSDPVHMERMRWFLREGWGPAPHYGMGRAIMRDAAAAVIVPCFEPRDLAMAIRLSAPRPVGVALEMNGRSLGALEIGPDSPRNDLQVPASSLFRGDNRLRLLAAEPGAEVRLELLNLRLLEAEPPAGGR